MTALLAALFCTLLVLMGANGIRMMRDDGTSQILGSPTDDTPGTESRGPMIRLIDTLGTRAHLRPRATTLLGQAAQERRKPRGTDP